jgi:hypothetical protein
MSARGRKYPKPGHAPTGYGRQREIAMSCTRQKSIVVVCSVWNKTKRFRVANKTYHVTFIQEARDILDKHGRTLIVKFQ